MQFPTPPRSSFGVVRCGDKIYIAGGHVGKFHNYSKSRFSSACHVLDIPSGIWSQIRNYGGNAANPEGISIQGLRLIEYKDEIYGFGGFAYEPGLDFNDPADHWQWYARSRSEIFKYAAKTDEWLEVGQLTRPRSSYVAGRIGKLAYLIGGWDGTPIVREDIFGRFYQAFEVFDLETQKVVPTDFAIDQMPMRRAFSGAASGDSVVVAGGLGPGTPNDPEGIQYEWVQAFTPTAPDPWKMLPPLPMKLFSPGLCVVDDTIVVAGGSGWDHKVNPDILLLKPGSPWARNKKIPTQVGTFMELIPLEGRTVLVLGGHGASTPLGLCETLEID